MTLVHCEWRIGLRVLPLCTRRFLCYQSTESSSSPRLRLLHVDEATEVPLEGGGDGAGFAVAVLGDDEVGFAGAFVFVVGVFAVQEDHHVGVLLEGAGLAEVAEEGLLVGALLGAAVELGDRDDGDLELLGEELDLAGELACLLYTSDAAD